MRQNLQQHCLAFGLLLATAVLVSGCRGVRCNLLSGCGSCPYGCTDYSDSACDGCDEDYHGVLSPPPLPATEGADVNMPPDVSAKALPKPREVRPTDIAPPSLRVAEQPRTERSKTKPKRPKALPESAPAEPVHREPTPATKSTVIKRVSSEQPTTGRFVDIVRPSARYTAVTPDTGVAAQARASRGEVYTAWYIERTDPLIIQGGPIHSGPLYNSPAHKSLAKIGPAKKVRSTLRFRAAGVVTLQAAGQSPPLGSFQSSSAVRPSTLASPPPRLQPVRIRSARR